MYKSFLLSKRMAVAALVLSLGITILIVVAFLIASTRGLLEMEKSVADEVLAQAKAVLNSKTEDLGAITQDYALWDDMLLYLEGRDPLFISKTFSNASLENLNLNFVALYGVQGELLWSWTTPGTPPLHPPKNLPVGRGALGIPEERLFGSYLVNHR